MVKLISGLLFGGVGLLGLLLLILTATIVHKKLESRQFLDVVIDYSGKGDDTLDASIYNEFEYKKI